MTELEAYEKLGWPPEGKGFILPMSNQGEEYEAFLCDNCGYKLIQVEGFEPDPRCHGCSAIYRRL